MVVRVGKEGEGFKASALKKRAYKILASYRACLEPFKKTVVGGLVGGGVQSHFNLRLKTVVKLNSS